MQKSSKKGKIEKRLLVVAIMLYLISAVMLYKGYDKMTNYRNSDYSSINVNAYVGGDAYNYIINGTYATAFFVLSAGFMITGTILLSSGMMIAAKKNDLAEETKQAPETSNHIIEGDGRI